MDQCIPVAAGVHPNVTSRACKAADVRAHTSLPLMEAASCDTCSTTTHSPLAFSVGSIETPIACSKRDNGAAPVCHALNMRCICTLSRAARSELAALAAHQIY